MQVKYLYRIRNNRSSYVITPPIPGLPAEQPSEELAIRHQLFFETTGRLRKGNYNAFP